MFYISILVTVEDLQSVFHCSAMKISIGFNHFVGFSFQIMDSMKYALWKTYMEARHWKADEFTAAET